MKGGASSTAKVFHRVVQVFLVPVVSLSPAHGALLLAKEARVTPLVAARVKQPPLLPIVEGHVATWTEAPVRFILHHARDHRHIWGDNVSNDAN